MDSGAFVLLFAPIVLIFVLIIYVISSKGKRVKGTCRSCKTELSPNDIHIAVGSLAWKREESSNGSYKQYYCPIYFFITCPKCAKGRNFYKTLNIYRTDSSHSRTTEDVYKDLMNKVKSTFPKDFFKGKEIEIGNVDELFEEIEETLCK